MKTDLEVIIKGRPLSGKTTLAYLLRKFLKSVGIKARLIDDSVPTASFVSKILKEYLDTGSILKGRKVTIRTARVMKTTKG